LTGSACSEDATDWDESDGDDCFPIQLGSFGKEPLDRGVKDLGQAMQVIIEKQLSPANAELVERLMEEFRVIFNQIGREAHYNVVVHLLPDQNLVRRHQDRLRQKQLQRNAHEIMGMIKNKMRAAEEDLNVSKILRKPPILQMTLEFLLVHSESRT
jgi:hypothetical protein